MNEIIKEVAFFLFGVWVVLQIVANLLVAIVYFCENTPRTIHEWLSITRIIKLIVVFAVGVVIVISMLIIDNCDEFNELFKSNNDLKGKK